MCNKSLLVSQQLQPSYILKVTVGENRGSTIGSKRWGFIRGVMGSVEPPDFETKDTKGNVYKTPTQFYTALLAAGGTLQFETNNVTNNQQGTLYIHRRDEAHPTGFFTNKVHYDASSNWFYVEPFPLNDSNVGETLTFYIGPSATPPNDL